MPVYKREKEKCKLTPISGKSLDDVKNSVKKTASKMSMKFQFPGIDSGASQLTLPDFKQSVSRVQQDIHDTLCEINSIGGNVPINLADILDRLFDMLGNRTTESLLDLLNEIWRRVIDALFPQNGIRDFLQSIIDRLNVRWNPSDPSTGSGIRTYNSPSGLATIFQGRDNVNFTKPENSITDLVGRLREILDNAATDLTTGGVPLVTTVGSGEQGVLDALTTPINDVSDIVERMVLNGSEPSESDITDMLASKIEEQNINSLDFRTGPLFCPEIRFDLRHYINISKDGTMPIVTPRRINSLKAIYDQILKPVVEFYMSAGRITEPGCALLIYTGLATREQVSEVAGNVVSKHLEGEAVDFGIRTIMSSTLFNDILNGIIPITYGVMSCHAGYVHITLPYTIDGQRIEKLAIEHEQRGTLADVKYKWQ